LAVCEYRTVAVASEISVPSLARRWDVSRQALHQWIANGDLKAEKRGMTFWVRLGEARRVESELVARIRGHVSELEQQIAHISRQRPIEQEGGR
jgi:predicted DNA-binding protein YlxM (UPF0122 family)